MSDHWEFFPCQLGEHKAFIFYNHGIREQINELDLPVCAEFCIDFKEPRGDGLPDDGETDDLTALEDRLAAELLQIGGVYVGRISVGGIRHFYAYVDATSAQIDALAAKLTVTTPYSVKGSASSDPDKSTYWHTLYPTKADWQMIQDLKVIEKLEQDGNPLDTARRIDHLAYFDDMRGADQFKAWLEAEGFDVDWMSRPDDKEDLLGISFSHVCRPMLGDVTQHTYKVCTKTEELGGRYSGWGARTEPRLN